MWGPDYSLETYVESDMTSYHVMFSKTWSWLESLDVLLSLETCNIATCHVWSGTKHYRMFDVNIL